MSDSIIWESPRTATQIDFSSITDFFTLRGWDGTFMRDINIASAEAIGVDGEIFGGITTPKQQVRIPLLTKADARDDYAANIGILDKYLRESNGNGKLIFTVGSETRVCRCRFSGGKLKQQANIAGIATLRFSAIEFPFWESETQSQVAIPNNEAGESWWEEFMWNTPQGGAYSTVDITNPGTVETDVTFITTGGSDDLIIQKNSPDGTPQLKLDRPILIGETITFNSGDQVLYKNKAISSIDGNIWKELTDSSLFKLSPDVNNLSVFANNADANFSVVALFTPKFNTAYG